MYKKIKLSNGLTLILAPKEGTQAVTVLILLPVGSRYETKEINGVSHFIEHMMFKGTPGRPTSLEVSRELDNIGAEYNAYTGKDHTGYYIKAAADKVELLFDILSDMLFNSKFDAVELEKERGVIVEEINMYEDNPLMYIESLYEQTIFGDHPLGWDIAGPAKVIKEVKRDQILKYLNSHYCSANMHMTVAGNFNEAKIKKLIDKYFNKKCVEAPKRKFNPFAFNQNQPKISLLFKETHQVQLSLGFPAYSYFHKDIYALYLLAIILGGNMSSRLFIKIRVENGLAYFVRAGADIYQDAGSLKVQAGLDKGRLDSAIKLILGELKKVRDEGVSAKELQNAKDFLKGKIILELEDSENVADWYGKQELLVDKILTPDERIAKINKVTLGDIARTAKDIIQENKLNLALIGPYKDKKEFEKLLKI